MASLVRVLAALALLVAPGASVNLRNSTGKLGVGAEPSVLPEYTDEDSQVMCKATKVMFPLMPSMDQMEAQRTWKPAGPDGSDSTRFYPTRAQLFKDLYHSDKSPYEGVEVGDVSFAKTWKGNAHINKDAIIKTVIDVMGEAPRMIVEVGSFLGDGASNVWGPLAKMSKSPDSFVLCVDSWEGDLNMKLADKYQQWLQTVNGGPKMQEVFMRRVKSDGMQDTVQPVMVPSIVGARFLGLLGYKVDLVYVDSAHEKGETFVELHLYYQMLRPGGLLMGDDMNWAAVAQDVRAFAKCNDLKVEFVENVKKDQWYIRKPLK